MNKRIETSGERLSKAQSRDNGGSYVKRLVSLFLAVVVLLSQLPAFSVHAAIYTFNKPTVAFAQPVAFENGSFETPAMPTSANVFRFPNVNTFTIFRPNGVPGWTAFNVANMTAASASANSVATWEIPTAEKCIELQKYMMQTNLYPRAVSGSQYAELNCYVPQRLNQTRATVPGTRLYWSFAHTGMPRSAPYIDVLNFYLMPGGNNGSQMPSASQIITTARTRGSGETASTAADLRGAKTTYTSAGGGWTYYTGVYTVPAGQTSTEFGWWSISSGSSAPNSGNFLDDIKFQTGASLIMQKSIWDSSGARLDGGYGIYNDVVTIRVKIDNYGETDAGPCVFTDTLWDGLTYISSSVSGDVGGAVSYNAATQTVTAYIGEDSSTTEGGVIKGSAAMGTSATTGKGQQAIVEIRARITGAAGSWVKNQAKCTYDDWIAGEPYNQATGGLTAYSVIDYQKANDKDICNTSQPGSFTMKIVDNNGNTTATYNTVDVNNADTYVNKFAIVKRVINGTVWTDANMNGMINTGETRMANQKLRLQKLVSSAWVYAKDYNGADLPPVTTDSSGRYLFEGIQPGYYRVVMDLPAGYSVTPMKSSAAPVAVKTATGTQGSADNDAVKDGSLAVVRILDLSASAFSPNSPTYYIHYADLGFVLGTPSLVKVKKDAYVGTSATAQNGTEAAPVAVNDGVKVTYKITVTNISSSPISASLSVKDTIPLYLTPGTVTPSTGSVSGQNVEWTAASLAPGDTVFTVETTAKSNLDGVWDNFATVTLGADSYTTNHTYHDIAKYDITIAKRTKGSGADVNKAFAYTVALSGSVPEYAHLNPKLRETLFNCTGSFSASAVSLGFFPPNKNIRLKNAQSMTIHDIPSGASYGVYEVADSAYTTSTEAKNALSSSLNTAVLSATSQYIMVRGKIQDSDMTITFTNTKDSAPQTGVLIDILPYALMVLLVAGIAAWIIWDNRRRRRPRGRRSAAKRGKSAVSGEMDDIGL